MALNVRPRFAGWMGRFSDVFRKLRFPVGVVYMPCIKQNTQSKHAGSRIWYEFDMFRRWLWWWREVLGRGRFIPDPVRVSC